MKRIAVCGLLRKGCRLHNYFLDGIKQQSSFTIDLDTKLWISEEGFPFTLYNAKGMVVRYEIYDVPDVIYQCISKTYYELGLFPTHFTLKNDKKRIKYHNWEANMTEYMLETHTEVKSGDYVNWLKTNVKDKDDLERYYTE